MPAPYLTAAEIIQQAHANTRHPYDEALHIAETYGWEDRATVQALHAIRRTMQNMPQPQPHHAIQLANEFAAEPDPDTIPLATLVASFLNTLTAYEQSGDPSEAEALERIEAELAHRVGLAPDPDEHDHGQHHPEDPDTH